MRANRVVVDFGASLLIDSGADRCDFQETLSEQVDACHRHLDHLRTGYSFDGRRFMAAPIQECDIKRAARVRTHLDHLKARPSTVVSRNPNEITRHEGART